MWLRGIHWRLLFQLVLQKDGHQEKGRERDLHAASAWSPQIETRFWFCSHFDVSVFYENIFSSFVEFKKKTFKDINKNFVGGANLIFIEWMTDALCLSAFSIYNQVTYIFFCGSPSFSLGPKCVCLVVLEFRICNVQWYNIVL